MKIILTKDGKKANHISIHNLNEINKLKRSLAYSIDIVDAKTDLEKIAA